MKALVSLALSSVFATSGLACGSLGDVGKRPPLAVLDGQLTQSSTTPAATPTADMRIAVVWASVDGTGYESTQDIPATPVFPSKFHLALTDLPSESVMRTDSFPPFFSSAIAPDPTFAPGATPAPPGPPPPSTPPAPPPPGARLHPQKGDFGPGADPDVRFAVGTVVAYADLNGNGKLDLVSESATDYVDQLLGTNESLLLVYIEGRTMSAGFTAPDGTKPSFGYNLVRLAQCGFSTAVCDVSHDGWLPMATLYDLPITAEPKLAGLMCKAGSSDGVAHADKGAPAAPSPPVPGPEGWPKAGASGLRCGPGGTSFLFCATVSHGLCGEKSSSCYGASLPTPPPPEWPCTIE